MTEAELLQSILRAYGARDDMRLWRQNTGVAKTPTGAVVRFGVPGQADISGILHPSGRRIEIECKAMGRKQTEAQRAWQRMIEKLGGIYILAYSVGDVARGLGL